MMQKFNKYKKKNYKRLKQKTSRLANYKKTFNRLLFKYKNNKLMLFRILKRLKFKNSLNVKHLYKPYHSWIQKKVILHFKKKKTYFILKNWVYFLYIKKCKKNIFANYSDIKGNVIFKTSSGCHHKRSLRKTFFATNFMLMHLKSPKVLNMLFLNEKKKRKKKLFVFLNLLGPKYRAGGLKKNLKNFLRAKKGSLKFFKITEIKCKAHNGVRLSKKRRK